MFKKVNVNVKISHTWEESEAQTLKAFFCSLTTHKNKICSLTTPINNPQKQNFEKMKKVSGDVIILHVCTKNHDHVVYASWDMECGRHNFL